MKIYANLEQIHQLAVQNEGVSFYPYGNKTGPHVIYQEGSIGGHSFESEIDDCEEWEMQDDEPGEFDDIEPLKGHDDVIEWATHWWLGEAPAGYTSVDAWLFKEKKPSPFGRLRLRKRNS